MDTTTYINELKEKYPLEYDCIISSFSTQKDINILLSIDKAYKAICKYCGWDIVPNEYVSATIQLATLYLNDIINVNKSVDGEKSVSQKVQGSRSIAFSSIKTTVINSDGLTDDIKAMLPLPKLRCFE